MTTTLSKAKALLTSAFLGDFRAIATLLRAIVNGTLVTAKYVSVTDAATLTLTADNTGRTIAMPDVTADITVTIPTAADGLDYTFVYVGAAADAQNWIITSTGTTLWTGGVLHLDTNAGAASDELVPVYAGAGGNVLTVITPDCGTRVHVWSDGTKWYVEGAVASATAPTFT